MNKSDFPLLQNGLIYLDSAATSHKPQCVIDAIERFYKEEYGTVHRAIYDLSTHATQKYNEVRENAAQFLNAAHTDEIIFTKGTTEGINLIASTFVKPGDEVIISQMEHHSNIVPWQLRGVNLKVIPIDARGQLILEEFEKLLTEKTKLVSIAHIANSTGTLNPIEKIIHMAHAKGARVLIDGAQSASHIPVDVQKLNADFFVFSGHKAYGPTGIGILYGKRELLEAMPPYQGGGDMIENVTFAKTTYQKAPLKFEAGTPPIAEVIGLGTALSYIESIGRDRIAAYEHDLLEYATAKMYEIEGLKIIGTAEKKGAIITFVMEGMHPLDIGTLLNLRGIAIRTGHLCAQPTLNHFGLSVAARISFAAYNTFEDIDACIHALKQVLVQLS